MVNFFIKTYGCQANAADSANVSRFLEELGATPVLIEDAADFIIVNTCAIREKAEHKMFSYLGELALLKRKKPLLVIGVIGCVASYRQKEIFIRFPDVDFVVGAREDIAAVRAHLVDKVEMIRTTKGLYSEVVTHETPLFTRSMINIMRGCNNYCSYCIVPFTTGQERSYPMAQILDLVRSDIARGAKEITLLGQNVNSYKDPETGASFTALLSRVAELEGDFWVRFVSPHPKDMTTDVLEVIASNDKLCSYIHLPLQSGSNKILELMNRTYTVEEYLALAEQVRKILPQATMTTDIIVGFPGETDEDYEQTRQVVEAVDFQTIFSFIYSPRKYTKAALLEDDCSSAVKHERLRLLQKRHREKGTMINKRLVGTTPRVLVEEYIPHKNCYIARTDGNIRVYVTGNEIGVNQFVKVKIESAQLSDLTGVVIEQK